MTPLRKSLSAGDLIFVAAALIMVPAAAAAGRLLRLHRAVRVTTVLGRWCPHPGVVSAERAAALVDAAGSRLGARCLTRALVLHALLGRRDSTTEVVVGAARRDGHFLSHAWVERGGEPLLGTTAGWTPVWRSRS